MNTLRSIVARLWKREAFTHARWEVAIMRVLFVLVFLDVVPKTLAVLQGVPGARWDRVFELDVIPHRSQYSEQDHPNGLAHLMDLTFLSTEPAASTIYYGCYAALVLYACGAALPLATGWLFLALLLHGTLHNSQGSVHHHLQVMTLILGVQWAASLAAPWFSRRRWSEWLWSTGAWSHEKWAGWSRQVMVAAYVVSAFSKIYMTKGLWMWKTPYLGVQLAKAIDQAYYDSLQHGTAGPEWLPEWCFDHPWLSRAIFGSALPLELLFFWALRNRRMSALYAIGLIAFHLSVSRLMSLDFHYNVQLLIIFFVNVPWWLRRPPAPLESGTDTSGLPVPV